MCATRRGSPRNPSLLSTVWRWLSGVPCLTPSHSSGSGESRRFRPFAGTSAHEGRSQMDIIPFHLCVGSYESGYHHGVGARVVVRECRFYSMKPLSLVLIPMGTAVATQLHHRHVPVRRCDRSGGQHRHPQVNTLFAEVRGRPVADPLSIACLVPVSRYAKSPDPRGIVH